MRGLSACLLVSAVLLGGCVTHSFVPGPGMATIDFEPDSAQCRLFARGARTGFAFGAAGSPRFVGAAMGGAAIGYAIGSAIEKNQNFNDCMQARGWRVADGQVASDPAMVGTLAHAEPPPIAPIQPPTRIPLNIRAAAVTPEMADEVRLAQPRGVMILAVAPDGAAHAAGLRQGDVILGFNGAAVEDQGDIQRGLAAITPSSTITAIVWRNGAERSIPVQF